MKVIEKGKYIFIHRQCSDYKKIQNEINERIITILSSFKGIIKKQGHQGEM